MYSNILVAIDPTHEPKHKDAIELATQLAKDANSEITAVSVIEPMPNYLPKIDIPEDMKTKAGEIALGKLRNFVGMTSEVKTRLLHGRAAHEILQFANENKIDCSIIASHQPGFSDYLLGSTAARVVRYAKCAVHITR